MEIRNIRVLRGPNYWSIRIPKLIVMTLDLQEMEERPSDKIPGFYERTTALIPTLQTHHCSEGHAGGFLERLKAGTWMGHIIEHIALEIQFLAGMDNVFGRTRGTGEHGVYFVVFSYKEEKVGMYAAEAAVRICEALINDVEYDLEADIQRMREIRNRERLGPSTKAIIKEAEKRDIPWIRLNNSSLCQLGYGSLQKRIQATVTSETSSIAVDLASDKEYTKKILEDSQIAIPKGVILDDKELLESACKNIGFPIVIKPINGNHGRGITTHIDNLEKAKIAFADAQKVSQDVIIEKHIQGFDYRLLVIDFKLVAAAKRTPAHVIGDGKLSIKKLIAALNLDPKRGYGHENILTQIRVDASTKKILKDNNLKLSSVLPKGKELILKDTANLSTGGTAEDVTDIVHPDTVAMAERIARIIDLDICGIDIMSNNISETLDENGGAVLEVNAGPGFRMHLAPSSGKPRNVAEPVIDKLFSHQNHNGRIPIVAVAGTNGKTTTTRLIAHIAKMNGCRVGYTTSDGVYIQNQMVMKGDCTGPQSSSLVLRDPTVNFAVLECARGGILRAGLAFHKCDVGIVTNVSEDHLGLKGIMTIDQLARVKSVIPETVMPEGYSILNADDDLVYAMRKNIKSKLALFSMDENNPRILEHQAEGGITAVYENGYVTLFRAEQKMRIMKVEEIPITFGGKAEFMIQNVLPAVLSSIVMNTSIQDIKAGLETFIPSPSQTPGRMNMYEFPNFKLLMDYAHNRAGMTALKGFTRNVEASKKVGIIAGIGDRREEDNFLIGKIAAEMFDEIILRHESFLRGRDKAILNQEVIDGIKSVKPDLVIIQISDEQEALKYAIKNAVDDSLLVVISDDITACIETVQRLKEEETVII